MPDIERYGLSRRWSDIVIYSGVAYWVEVAEDPAAEIEGQTAQILAQIDATLVRIRSDRTALLQVLIYLADLADVGRFNKVWDRWIPEGAAPVRACVQVGLPPPYRVEMVITAARTRN
jgi:enamine deaminase RidA (YjgF/YER057c/UK114 family)